MYHTNVLQMYRMIVKRFRQVRWELSESINLPSHLNGHRYIHHSTTYWLRAMLASRYPSDLCQQRHCTPNAPLGYKHIWPYMSSHQPLMMETQESKMLDMNSHSHSSMEYNLSRSFKSYIWHSPSYLMSGYLISLFRWNVIRLLHYIYQALHWIKNQFSM